jgi:DNA-binding NarL/FixJ family response regulator
VVVDPAVVQSLMRRRRAAEPLARLSPREREVLGLMASGRSNASLSRDLCLSPTTVDRRTSRIFTKLGLDASPDEHRRVRAG